MVYPIEPCIIDEELWDLYDEETEKHINHPSVRLVNRSTEFKDGNVCFNYALNADYLCCCEEAYEELERFYFRISIQEAKEGDIISYHEIIDYTDEEIEYLHLSNDYKIPSSYNALHFAVILETDGTIEGTLIRSKWGNDGVFETNLFSVPDSYGNTIQIWRKK